MQGEAGFDPTASGAWRGFYVHSGSARRHAMRLDLVFDAATVRGDGTDDVGRFTVRGAFEPDGVRVWWHKQYAGAHSVWYEGVRDGAQPRLVYGGWRIDEHLTGGFKIWRGAQSGECYADAVAADVEADRSALVHEVLRR